MKIVLSLLAVLLVLAGVTFGTLIGARRTEKAFALIKVGDGRAQVVHVMGEPNRASACTALPRPPEGCAEELLYAHRLAPVVPEYWVVRLSASGKVLQTVQSTVRSSY